MEVQARCSNSSSGPACYEEASDSVAVVVIPTVLVISSVVVVSLIFCSILRKRRISPLSFIGSSVQNTNKGQHCSSLGAVPLIPCGVREALHPWEMPAEWDVDGVELLCTGSYGPVCVGWLTREGRSAAVVVKALRDPASPSEEREFAEWILFHAKVCNNKSERLVRMLCCQAQRLPMYLVLEAHSPGNLLHFLWGLREKDSDKGPLHVSERSVFLLATQVAEGLDYLLTEHRVVHGYVAARNILIGPDLSARVSGLGTAFAEHQTDRTTMERPMEVPLKWLAPERITNQPAFHRSDVWSFGILLYELITSGSPPYPELEPQSVLPHLQSSYRMEQPEGCGAPLYNLMKYCWMWSFKDRPTFSAIIKLLGSTLDLAATEALPSQGLIDAAQYNKIAGIHPHLWQLSPDSPIKHESSAC
ncbi:tyrosine-protein kinase STYK1 isoform X1 [Gadus chalcogrammus]|uniref:tyrosine-protein kinase STYK1 isoform X1 n=1 Tax=Gadus chalcogrammus TaxID=1042646 RepID=UPI0024C33FDA|nr:tyrosine-protein kinase STYK1 isoform X1 [Gadus chalcogrammus]